MIQKLLLILIGLILGLTVALFLPAKSSPPTVELDELPKPYYSVLWENEHVRIVEHSMQPGDSEPMHTHPEMLAYIMESSKLLVTESNGTTNEVDLTKGEFQQLPTWTHSIKNIGDTPLHTLLVELKP
jgi:quercetin dioxygenase-like cupin family protein